MNATTHSTGPVVTLFESYGSGADQIAHKVAEALGVEYLGQRFSSEQLEDAATVQEADGDSAFLRFFKRFGQENTDHLDNILIPADQRNEYNLVVENNRTIIEATASGGVVLGRNATVILADNPKALHVKLDGPVEARIARAATEAGIDPDRAAGRQVHEDEVRAEMSIRLYNWDPRQNDHYDLVINTGRLDDDVVAEIIVSASRVKAARAN